MIEDCQEKKTYLVANGITEDAGELIKKTEQKIKEKKNLRRNFRD